MGFTYTNNGKLCCDVCGHTPARKKKCPHGWCQSTALCPDCAAKYRGQAWKDAHKNCKPRAEAFRAEEAKKAAMIEAGALIRCAALSMDSGFVKVIFRGKQDAAFFMSHAAYDSIPIGETATPEDYRAKGFHLVSTENLDIYQDMNEAELWIMQHPEISAANKEMEAEPQLALTL